ncbi:MAG: GntR family transcriptional regulator, partial [Oscillospiraceae bacterium]
MTVEARKMLTLSQQAKSEIYRYIKGMDLKKNNKLPREEALAEQIGVSRITIRQALNDLSAEGTVFRRQGKGTFVNVDSLNIKVKFSPCMEFSQMIQNSGYTPSVKLLNIAQSPRDEAICDLLQMGPEEQLVV